MIRLPVCVKFRHCNVSAARPLLHRKRKSIHDLAMSHKCLPEAVLPAHEGQIAWRRAQARRTIPQCPIADKKKPGTRYPCVRASHSTLKTSTYRLERVLNHVGRDLWAHVLAGAHRESVVNAAPNA